MMEHTYSGSKALHRQDAASIVIYEALVNYYLDTRNFQAIAKLQEQQAAACRTVWVSAIASVDGEYYIPDEAMRQIEARIKQAAAAGNTFMPDPLYFMNQMKERLVAEYLSVEGNPFYFVPF
ncbi:hypothetical protein [Paenibacillus montanisoli]|uniref:Uncharacterized protein n=1 Tax=Paenibacillus montanisoli TaxID=2081970 RepID=A0A328TZX3_9BACL|nr:hypothetical protein [Paenibacillus montanisoli]RAP75332.1 hypothetical protein DL346_18380 [Paenibacillus montanisoli]